MSKLNLTKKETDSIIKSIIVDVGKEFILEWKVEIKRILSAYEAKADFNLKERLAKVGKTDRQLLLALLGCIIASQLATTDQTNYDRNKSDLWKAIDNLSEENLLNGWNLVGHRLKMFLAMLLLIGGQIDSIDLTDIQEDPFQDVLKELSPANELRLIRYLRS